MAALTPDTTAADILEDLRATLAAATVAGAAVFASVGVYDDLDSFTRTAGTIADAKPVAAVIGSPAPERGRPMDNGAAYTERLAVQVAVRFKADRLPGQAEQGGVSELNRLGGLVRQALLIDKGRGGRAGLVEWAGRPLDGTDVYGPPRLAPAKASQAFFVALLPVAVGWER